MRLPRTHSLLTLKLKHGCVDNVMHVTAYGSDFEPLPVIRKIDHEIEIIEISTYLPNTVMLVLSGKTAQDDDRKFIELLDMSLVGVKINKDILLDRVEYKPNLLMQLPDSLQQYLDHASTTQLLTWGHNGCVLFDLFDNDPFAYLLKIGNKIKF
jgi:hypothetical protein